MSGANNPALLLSPFDAPLDLTTSEGTRLFNTATRGFESEEKYDGSPANLSEFLDKVQVRVMTCRWENIFIMTIEAGGTATANLLDDHGALSLERVKEVRDARNAAANVTREQQCASMAYIFLMNSIKDRALQLASNRSTEIAKDGPTLLKILLAETATGTRMSAFQIKAQLGKLSLKSYGYKVEEMHADVRKNIKLLKAARETHADLPLNLFNAYESAPSEEFRFEIRSLKHRYNQGEALTGEQIMSTVQPVYDDLKAQGKWITKDPKDAEIIALKAQIQKLEAKMPSKQDNDDKEGKRAQRGKGKGKGKGKDDKKRRQKPEWYYQNPNNQERMTKDGKNYRWCAPHPNPYDSNSKGIHFREHVRNGTIKIKYVKSENQLADILTKPLREHAFVRLRKRLCGW